MGVASKALWTLGVAVFAAGLAGCQNQAPVNADFGNAVRHNISSQVINPEPPYAAAGAPDMNGARAADGYDRYLTGRVKEPERQATSTLSSGSGN